jgi:hypothetical protein
VPGVPADLAAIVRKAMMARPEERYADGAELAADLRRHLLGQVVVAPRPDDAHDPAMERAFHEELRDRSVRALRIMCLLALVLLPVFAVIARVNYGRFDRRDIVPRLIAITFFALVLGVTTSSFGRRFAQGLSALLVLLVGCMIIAQNTAERGALEAGFTGSMVLIQLGCATLLPITPRRLLAILAFLTLATIPAAHSFGVGFGDTHMIIQLSLFVSSTGIAVVGAWLNYRIRRAEFYNRHRLQSANERLAKLGYDRP